MRTWACAAAGIVLAGPGLAATCAADKVTVIGDWGQAPFSVTVADEPSERSQGLMFVDKMATLEGMLFVYDAPQYASFWMKNTLIPLDMLFADARGVILRVHANAVPLDETPIDGGPGVAAVLEINGGMADRLGIGPGDVLQHPSFGDDAAQPCAG